ncbi:hypothetical protein [Fodinicurvata sp. EGI_FJ10296]|uniref:hypothetical protein n=1 Tax=Fodinicurvata sp. EGI_FJ10296 TaxID=3231908 RepID=UPI00345472E6
MAGGEVEAEDLRRHRSAFCDADNFPERETLTDRMEAAGLIQLMPVDEQALEDPFAAERGIEPGGVMWTLTKAGYAILEADIPNQKG